MKSPLAFRLLCLSLAFGCAATSERSSNPLLNTENDPVIIPAVEEQLIGTQAAAAVARQYKAHPDAGLQAYLREQGLRLAKAASLPGIRFTVLEHPMVNAFALPGGHVYVTTGILKKLKDEAELAAVLGHEVGHVLKKHGLKNLQRQAVASQGIDFLLSLLSQNTAKFVEVFAGPAAQLLFLRNGREAELESDEAGLMLSSKAGLDPSAMVEVQEMLMKQGGGTDPLFGDMLASHPASSARISQARALLPRFEGPVERGEARYRAQVLSKLK